MAWPADMDAYRLAVEYNFVPHEDSKFERTEITHPDYMMILAKKRDSVNVLFLYDRDALHA